MYVTKNIKDYDTRMSIVITSALVLPIVGSMIHANNLTEKHIEIEDNNLTHYRLMQEQNLFELQILKIDF